MSSVQERKVTKLNAEIIVDYHIQAKYMKGFLIVPVNYKVVLSISSENGSMASHQQTKVLPKPHGHISVPIGLSQTSIAYIHCETSNTGLVHLLFTPQFSLVLMASIHQGMAMLS